MPRRHTLEWTVTCKRCGELFGYSELSQEKVASKGFSRPEYCKDCRKLEIEDRGTMGVSYFNLLPREGLNIIDIQAGVLGMLDHPEREHTQTKKEGLFEERDYGLTPKKMLEIFNWFKDPKHQVAVVVGPTGSGKSTALPHWLMYPPLTIPSDRQDQFTKNGQILVTEPRILATQGIAEHVGGTLLGGSVGEGFDVGFRHSKGRETDWRNTIVYETDGVLLNLIQKDDLDKFGVIMIDEAHERSLNIDLIIRLLRDKLPIFPKLKLIIASATINAELFRDYFEKGTAKIIKVKGKDAVGYVKNFATDSEALPYDDPKQLREILVPSVVKKIKWLVKEMLEGKEVLGDVLVFLHGVDPIIESVDLLNSWINGDLKSEKKIEVYPLYSKLSQKEQEVVKQANKDKNKIRIIVSTNIAEASVTIDGVVHVVETGVEYQPTWNIDTRTTEIKMVTISRANARQRWGRCGRTKKGFVHCLYSEEQFGAGVDDDDKSESRHLFRKYPIPDIQRVNLETVVLNAVASGVTDLYEGWLEKPLKAELDRSISTLVENKALDDRVLLTDYGALLRYFPYTSVLADLIMLADRFGCAPEITALVPILKNGGYRRILSWEKNWDRYTKSEAAKAHRTLMKGCFDDIEFVLKIYSVWSSLGGKSKKETERLRENWSTANYIDNEKMIEAEKERQNVLERLFVKTRFKDYGKIRLSLLSRVKFLMLIGLSDQMRNANSESDPNEYTFDQFTNPDSESYATFSTYIEKENLKIAKKLARAAKKKNYFVISEALRDVESNQARSLGEDTKARLHLQFMFPRGAVVEGTVISINKKDKATTLQIDSSSSTSQNKTKPSNDVQEWPKNIEVFLDPYEDQISANTEKIKVNLVVKDFSFSEEGKGSLVVGTASEKSTFELFIENHDVGDEILLDVVGIRSYPMDYERHLVALEPNSGEELMIDGGELGFTSSSAILDLFSTGKQLNFFVERIDLDEQHVYASLLPFVQEKLEKLISEKIKRGRSAIVSGKVLEIRDDEKIIFLLEWSNPDEDFFLVVIAQPWSFAGKSLDEFSIGDKHSLRVDVERRKPISIDLDKVPKKVRHFLEDQRDEKVWLDKKTLYAKGRISLEEKFELESLSKKGEYRTALDRISWLTNQILVSQVIDEDLILKLAQKYKPNTLVDVIVKNAIKHGIFVELEPDVEGYIYVGNIYEHIDDASTKYAPGEILKAKVIEFSHLRGRFDLTLKIPENNPWTKYEKGQKITGTVKSIADFGAFVELEPGIEALAGIRDAERFSSHDPLKLSEGQNVIIEIVNVDLSGEKKRVGIIILKQDFDTVIESVQEIDLPEDSAADVKKTKVVDVQNNLQNDIWAATDGIQKIEETDAQGDPHVDIHMNGQIDALIAPEIDRNGKPKPDSGVDVRDDETIFEQCLANPDHKYPNDLDECPYCLQETLRQPREQEALDEWVETATPTEPEKKKSPIALYVVIGLFGFVFCGLIFTGGLIRLFRPSSEPDKSEAIAAPVFSDVPEDILYNCDELARNPLDYMVRIYPGDDSTIHPPRINSKPELEFLQSIEVYARENNPSGLFEIHELIKCFDSSKNAQDALSGYRTGTRYSSIRADNYGIWGSQKYKVAVVDRNIFFEIKGLGGAEVEALTVSRAAYALNRIRDLPTISK